MNPEVLNDIRRELTMIMSRDQYKEYMLAVDKFGIFKQRRQLGLPVWRGREWWMV